MKKALILWALAVGLLIVEFGLPNASAYTEYADPAQPSAESSFRILLLCVVSLSVFVGTIEILLVYLLRRPLMAPKTAIGKRLLEWRDQVGYYCGVLSSLQPVLLLWVFLTEKRVFLPLNVLPSPDMVLQKLIDLHAAFAGAALWSAGRLLISFLLAGCLGLVCGIVLGRTRQAYYIIPYTRILAVLPPIVLAPFLFFLFSPKSFSSIFGQDFADRVPDWIYAEAFRIGVVSFSSFWIVLSSSLKASAKTRPEFLYIAEGLGATWLQRLRHVVLPLSLPSVLWDCRVGLTIGFIVLLYVEGINASRVTWGLGAFIEDFRENSNNAALFALIGVVAAIITLLHKLLDLVAAVWVKWDFESDPYSLLHLVVSRRANRHKIALPAFATFSSLADRVGRCSNELIRNRTKWPPGVPTIGLDRIHASFRGKAVLSISRQLVATSGQVVALIGESGNGKTSLSRIIAGLTRHGHDGLAVTGGTLQVNDAVIYPSGIKRRGRITPGVAYMFQNEALFPNLTVRDNLMLAYRYSKTPLDAATSRVANAVSLVRLEHRVTAFPHELSGGERQRLALARALSMDCPILIVDEGLASIDQPSKSLLRGTIRALTRELNLTTLYISHDREDVLQLADRIWYLKDGDIVADEAPHDLYYDAKTIDTARFLGHTNLFRGVVDGMALKLCSYVDFPRPVDCTVVIPQKAATVLSNREASVVACIPRNWIQISPQCSADGLVFKNLAGAPAFSGSDWEFRIEVAGGVQFDVIMEDDQFTHLAKLIEQKTPLSVMINDVALLSDSYNETSA